MTARDYWRLFAIAAAQVLLAVVALGALPGCARLEYGINCTPRPGLLDTPECERLRREMRGLL